MTPQRNLSPQRKEGAERERRAFPCSASELRTRERTGGIRTRDPYPRRRGREILREAWLAHRPEHCQAHDFGAAIARRKARRRPTNRPDGCRRYFAALLPGAGSGYRPGRAVVERDYQFVGYPGFPDQELYRQAVQS